MYVESSTLQIIEIAVVGVMGAIATPFIIYFMGQNSDRKKELAGAFESLRQQRDTDQNHQANALGEMRDRVTVLQTTVNLKKEAVDKVQGQQIADGMRLVTLEANVTTIKE